MNLQELKTTLHQQIDQAEESFLHTLQDIIATYNQGETTKIELIQKFIISPDPDWSAKLINQLSGKPKKKEKPVKRFYSLEDLEKNMEVW